MPKKIAQINKSSLSQKKANLHDLHAIITLLFEDELGQTREHLNATVDQCYIDAFN